MSARSDHPIAQSGVDIFQNFFKIAIFLKSWPFEAVIEPVPKEQQDCLVSAWYLSSTPTQFEALDVLLCVKMNLVVTVPGTTTVVPYIRI